MSVTTEVNFSPAFSTVLGLATGSRATAVKAVWAYAATHGLKSNRQVTDKNGKARNAAVIVPNADLKTVFGDVEFLGLGEIAKGISANVVK